MQKLKSPSLRSSSRSVGRGVPRNRGYSDGTFDRGEKGCCCSSLFAFSPISIKRNKLKILTDALVRAPRQQAWIVGP